MGRLVSERPSAMTSDPASRFPRTLIVAAVAVAERSGDAPMCVDNLEARTLLARAHPHRELNRADEEEAEAVAAEGAQAARPAGANAVSRVVRERDGTVETLAQLADDERAWVIVAGSRGRSPWSSLLLGSVTRLPHRSSCLLLIVRPPHQDDHAC